MVYLRELTGKQQITSLSLSLSLSHTHTMQNTHTHTFFLFLFRANSQTDIGVNVTSRRVARATRGLWTLTCANRQVNCIMLIALQGLDGATTSQACSLWFQTRARQLINRHLFGCLLRLSVFSPLSKLYLFIHQSTYSSIHPVFHRNVDVQLYMWVFA